MLRVAEIWRYPVKSLQGEQLQRAWVGESGIEGDRTHAIWDLEADIGLTARRVPELLWGHARAGGEGEPPMIELPNGSRASDEGELSAWLERRVELRGSDHGGPRRYENPEDFEDEQGRWRIFEGSSERFHDSERARLSLVSTTTLGSWDRRRFRSNLVLEGSGEDRLEGAEVDAGGVRLRIGEPIGRCVMTTRPQPGGIGADPDVMREIAAERGGKLAVAATVVTPGEIAVGDRLVPVPPSDD